MDSIKSKPASAKSRLVRTIQKLVHIQTATRPISNCGILKLKSQDKAGEDDPEAEARARRRGDDEKEKNRNRAALEAFISKLFAGVSSVKAAYAELQLAQSPYDGDAIQSADEALVKELKVLSELKHGFLRKEVDPCPPHVTVMLSEIQEQQSLMRTYEITVKSLESRVKVKDSEISSLQAQLDECDSYNKSMEKKLNSSGYLYAFENITLATLNPNHFIQVLHYALKSIRHFVKQMIREMESANWDLEAAANCIESGIVYAKPSHRCFVFESFVTRELFDGFNFPNFSLSSDFSLPDAQKQHHFFERFKKLKSANPRHFIATNPQSAFAAFTRGKYLKLVHPKMECSLFGNLRQRNLVTSGECPDSAFFVIFAEMAKRVWLLHSLAYSFDEEPSIFLVRKNCRFSEVFMECVNDDESMLSSEDFQVAFTVVPGFKICKTVIQSQVYLSPVTAPAS
ncbi:protein GRAVITROPIC IN THE LIGHT 1 [Malania oleifera]|uniref:protein GRAVITROPIC IN THE LIGHT 1 n=1 Tax=Malania oleifera TaxID=397392 RepID=UPI0025AE8886|nr:protein GRAVITROPIC IN THE LIGHT 1 [Malania oleifera]